MTVVSTVALTPTAGQDENSMAAGTGSSRVAAAPTMAVAKAKPRCRCDPHRVDPGDGGLTFGQGASLVEQYGIHGAHGFQGQPVFNQYPTPASQSRTSSF